TAGTERLHLGPEEHETRLVGVDDGVVVAGPAVRGDHLDLAGHQKPLGMSGPVPSASRRYLLKPRSDPTTPAMAPKRSTNRPQRKNHWLLMSSLNSSRLWPALARLSLATHTANTARRSEERRVGKARRSGGA